MPLVEVEAQVKPLESQRNQVVFPLVVLVRVQQALLFLLYQTLVMAVEVVLLKKALLHGLILV
jgi:hypothetical protein